MNETELLLLRLEDISESSENKDARVLAKALKRYFENVDKKEIGFKNET
jgi:hypothetical protein